MSSSSDFQAARMAEIRMALLKIREHRGMIRTAEAQKYLDLLLRTLDSSIESSEKAIDDILDLLFELSNEDYTLALSFLSLTIRLLKWEDTFGIPESESDLKIVQRIKRLFDSAKNISGEHCEYYLIKANEFMSYLRAVRPTQLELKEKEGISNKYWSFLFDLQSQEKARSLEYVQELIKIQVGSHFHDYLSRFKGEKEMIEILMVFSSDILKLIENYTDSLLHTTSNGIKETSLTDLRHVESWWNILLPAVIKALDSPELRQSIEPFVFEEMLFQVIRIGQFDNLIALTLAHKLTETILELYGKSDPGETKWDSHVRVLYGQIVLKKLTNMIEGPGYPASFLEETMIARLLTRLFTLRSSPMAHVYLTSDILVGKRSIIEETVSKLFAVSF